MKYTISKAEATVAAILAISTPHAHSATADPAELASLRAEVIQSGAVPVTVHLQSVPLAALKDQGLAIRAAIQVKAKRLMDELGKEAWSAGQWDNGAGQIGMYVTAKGLDMLQVSANAISFFQGNRWLERTSLNGMDGGLKALEDTAKRSGFVDVEVTLNVDGASMEMDAKGNRSSRGGAAALTAATEQARALITSLSDTDLANRGAANKALLTLESRGGSATDHSVTLRVTRQGLIRLSESDAVRALRPVGHVDARARHFDSSAKNRAARDGFADVILMLRDAGQGGKLSAATREANKAANKAALAEITASVGATEVLRDISEFGAFHVRLNADQLSKLEKSSDARLIAVVDNKPAATTQLATSGPTMNVQSPWNVGYRGSGQNAVVFDTGVSLNHPFLSGKVTQQGCFGTTAIYNSQRYVSVCPSANAMGDSPWNTALSGASAFNGSCSTVDPDACSHGTHVAGIMAGRQFVGQSSGVEGIAPDANVIAIQVFSYDPAHVVAPTAFGADLLAALQLAAGAVVANTPAANPYTINMSLGGGQYTAPCNDPSYSAFVTAIQTLRNAGVPVVAATGNDGYDNAISWPACMPGIIKVSAVGNNGVNATRSFFNASQGANVANPSNFSGETFWVAPGGGNGTAITSSVIGGYGGMAGTSQATPHIAGVYMLGKSAVPTWTLNDATNYFVANASALVPMTTRSGAALNFSIRRVRFPVY